MVFSASDLRASSRRSANALVLPGLFPLALQVLEQTYAISIQGVAQGTSMRTVVENLGRPSLVKLYGPMRYATWYYEQPSCELHFDGGRVDRVVLGEKTSLEWVRAHYPTLDGEKLDDWLRRVIPGLYP